MKVKLIGRAGWYWLDARNEWGLNSGVEIVAKKTTILEWFQRHKVRMVI